MGCHASDGGFYRMENEPVKARIGKKQNIHDRAYLKNSLRLRLDVFSAVSASENPLELPSLPFSDPPWETERKMKNNVGFVCFGEVNTPYERLQIKHDAALKSLTQAL